MEVITKDEWVKWKNDPVTKFFGNALHTRREILKEDLANDAISGDTIQQYIGACKALKEAIDYAFRDFEYVETNEEPSGD